MFINYILRPEVHAALTNKVFYANPNKASLKFVQKDVAANPSVFLKPDDLARMTVPALAARTAAFSVLATCFTSPSRSPDRR